MNPFSCCLREIRQERKLLQKDMAELIGCEQSYLSALETGAKGIAKPALLDQIANKLQLDDKEKTKLFNAAKKSRRSFYLPKQASIEVFEIFHELERQIPVLSSVQLELIAIALKLNQSMIDSDNSKA